MSRFSRHHPDDYEARFERMIDAADHQRKARREDDRNAHVAEPLRSLVNAMTRADAPQGPSNTKGSPQ